MAGPNSQECADIPALLVAQDAPGSVHSCRGSLFFDAYKNMDPKTAKVVGTDAADNYVNNGSGFFVGDGTHFVTNAHVVEDSQQLHIDYQGKTYAAQLEKLDDIGDMAQLKVVGLVPDQSRVQDTTPAPLALNERIVGEGIPGASNETKYLSPGAYLGSNRLYNLLSSPQMADPEAQRMTAAYNSGDPVLAQMAQQRANVPRLVVEQGGRPGNSGTLVDDAGGRLVGMMTTVNGNNGALLVPAKEIDAFVKSPESKFNFNYEVRTASRPLEPLPLAADAAGAGAEALGLLGKGRFAPLAFAGLKAVSLYHDIADLASGDAPSGTGRKLLEDGAMVVGGITASALWSNPVGKFTGLGLMGLGLAGRTAQDLTPEIVPTGYVLNGISRKNGDSHPIWSIK